ncbi:hypothetical protein Mpsy_0719 [Methanolobus psychrophilus R15]|nr:hypothetical protein Mpsy_0719 [Methanolobus psychrophilus R15]
MLLAALPVAIGRASAVGETFEEVLRYAFPRLCMFTPMIAQTVHIPLCKFLLFAYDSLFEISSSQY